MKLSHDDYDWMYGAPSVDEFNKRVNAIGRRKAVRFFFWRLLAIGFFLYFAIAAYGCYHHV